MPKLWTETIDAHRRAVRDAALDATAALVAEHGLTSVTMSQIATETGVGRATLYKYFPDVEAILLAWHERQITRHLQHLAMPLRQCEWVVYAKRPFSGPEAVLAYLSRYTHRVAISNSRLLACDDRGVTFRWKDYREHGRTRYKTMTVATDEFMRRCLLHVLPSGCHRIRHYGVRSNANRKTHIATAREVLHQPPPPPAAEPGNDGTAHGIRPTFRCRHCGAPMLVIETFARAQHIRAPPPSPSPP